MDAYFILTIGVIILSLFISNNCCRKLIFDKENIKVNSNTLKNSFILNIMILSVSIFCGLRFGIGTDYNYTYVPIFNEVLNGNFNVAWGEFGFRTIVYIITLFTKNPVWLFIICSYVTTRLVLVSIFDYSDSFLTSICLFWGTEFFFVSLNNIRQCMAFAVCLYALRYLKRTENKKYIITILLAMSIHISSIVYIPLLFVKQMSKCAYKVFILLPAICILLKPVLYRLLPLIIEKTQYSYYYSSKLYLNATTNFPNQAFNYLLFILFVLILYFNSDGIDNFQSMYLLLQSITCCLYMFDGIIPATYRVIRLFSFFQIISIPNVVSLVKNKAIKRIILIGIVVVALYICYLDIYISGFEQVVPYVSIFD